MRKPGRRKDNYDDESTSRVLKTMKSLVRVDWGGKNAQEQIQKKMKELGVECGPQSAVAIERLVMEQIDSVRKRCFPRVDEAIRRCSDEEVDNNVVERMP